MLAIWNLWLAIVCLLAGLGLFIIHPFILKSSQNIALKRFFGFIIPFGSLVLVVEFFSLLLIRSQNFSEFLISMVINLLVILYFLLNFLDAFLKPKVKNLIVKKIEFLGLESSGNKARSIILETECDKIIINSIYHEFDKIFQIFKQKREYIHELKYHISPIFRRTLLLEFSEINLTLDPIITQKLSSPPKKVGSKILKALIGWGVGLALMLWLMFILKGGLGLFNGKVDLAVFSLVSIFIVFFISVVIVILKDYLLIKRGLGFRPFTMTGDNNEAGSQPFQIISTFHLQTKQYITGPFLILLGSFCLWVVNKDLGLLNSAFLIGATGMLLIMSTFYLYGKYKRENKLSDMSQKRKLITSLSAPMVTCIMLGLFLSGLLMTSKYYNLNVIVLSGFFIFLFTIGILITAGIYLKIGPYKESKF